VRFHSERNAGTTAEPLNQIDIASSSAIDSKARIRHRCGGAASTTMVTSEGALIMSAEDTTKELNQFFGNGQNRVMGWPCKLKMDHSEDLRSEISDLRSRGSGRVVYPRLSFGTLQPGKPPSNLQINETSAQQINYAKANCSMLGTSTNIFRFRLFSYIALSARAINCSTVSASSGFIIASPTLTESL